MLLRAYAPASLEIRLLLFLTHRTPKCISDTIKCRACVLDMCAGVMSSKRKTSARTRVLVDEDICQSVDQHITSLSSLAPVDHDDDDDSNQSQDRSLRVVTSPSSLSAADDDDVTDDVTVPASCCVSESSCLIGGPSTPPADVKPDVTDECAGTGRSQRQWLSSEVTCVLKKIELVIAAAGTLDEKRRRVDDMLTELEMIRRHLLMAQSDTATASLSVSVTVSY